MKKKKIAVLGHFVDKELASDGQTIKTIMVYDQLLKKNKNASLFKLSTHGWIKRPIKFFLDLVKTSIEADDIVLLPAHKGVRIMLPILIFLRKIHGTKLHYVVVGGWLPDYVKNKPFLGWAVRKTDFVYLETQNMLKRLRSEVGLENCYLLRNFKDYTANFKNNKNLNGNKEILDICTLSRVNEQKGITDAVHAVNLVNKTGGRYRLTVYGRIDDKYKLKFNELLKKSNSNVVYGGILKDKDIPKELSKMYFMLFPTRYWTEGIPGSIIDAYSVGLPIVSSRWLHFNEVIDEGITGYGYEFEDVKDLHRLIQKLSNNKRVDNLRSASMAKFNLFTPEKAMRPLLKNLGI